MVRLDLFKWYKYGGKLISYEENRHNREYILEIHPGNLFGIRKLRGKYVVVHKNSPDILFTLKKIEIDRLVEHSNGWSGKVRKITVKAGKGGLDKPKKVPADPKLRVLNIDSSNLLNCTYDIKNKTLYVEFRNGAVWAYEKVTTREVDALEDAPSQGRYFIYMIRGPKPQYRVDAMPTDSDMPPTALAPAQVAAEETPDKGTELSTKVIHPSGRVESTRIVKPEPRMPPVNDGKKLVKLKLGPNTIADWLDSEEGSFADHDESPTHVYAAIKSKQITNETELLKMLGSLSSSTFKHVNQTGFRAAVRSLLKIGDEYPFTPSGAKTYDAVKAQLKSSVSVTTQEF